MRTMIESLEPRRLLSAKVVPAPPPVSSLALSVSDVQTILAQAGSQAMGSQAIVVVDREGSILGMFGGSQLGTTDPISQQIFTDAVARARTAAFFESTGEAFSSRTARFIIEDHFPWPIRNTPGGPLYGVEFSSLVNSNVLLPSTTPAISGDPGGIPLFINGIPVGGIGVAGDFHDLAARPDFVRFTQSPYDANPKGLIYEGQEEKDFDEAVALAGAKGYLPPPAIRANQIFIDGLRLPFVAEAPASGRPAQTFSQLVTYGSESLRADPALDHNSAAIVAGEPEKNNFIINANANGVPVSVPGLLRMHSNVGKTDPESSDPIVGSSLNQSENLTAADVLQIITQAVSQAIVTRAGIRKPNGVNAVVHVAVVDTQGNVLGVFRMNDGTNFSYDVAVQKARTAAFFSDNQHAFSSRAIGFMSQLDFPVGIPHDRGPLFQLQDSMDVNMAPGVLNPNLTNTPLGDGITIFPGGFPLYKNGVLVGGIGISGDGVDQDDIIGYAGTAGFRPARSIESDQLTSHDIANFIDTKVAQINAMAGISFDISTTGERILKGLAKFRLPYVKFPRNPEH